VFSWSKDKDRIYDRISELKAEISIRMAEMNVLEAELSKMLIADLPKDDSEIELCEMVSFTNAPDPKDLTQKKRGEIGKAVGDVVASILKDAGRSLPAETIYKLAVKQGYKFPGASPCTNMAAHLYHQKHRFTLDQHKHWKLISINANGGKP
jgi:hypothetical protein